MAGCSVASITLPTKFLSQTTMGMFSMTPADLNPAAQKSWRLFKISFVRDQQINVSEIDYMQCGSSVVTMAQCVNVEKP